jgi:hypothetical protein
MTMIDIEPISLLAIVGTELFKHRLRELAAQCDTKRKFNRALEKEILPIVRLVFDHHVAKDVVEAARAIYGRRGHDKVRTTEVQGVRDSGTRNDQVRGAMLQRPRIGNASSGSQEQRRL